MSELSYFNKKNSFSKENSYLYERKEEVMTKEQRETLERLTDFDYAWYKENVLDKKAGDEVERETEKVDEPAGDYENIPSHHLAAIERGLADAAAGRMISGEDFRKEMRAKFGL